MAGIDVITKDGTTYQMMPASTAGQFSSTTAYAVGDFVYFDGVLYKCKTAHTGAFVASHFTAVTVGAELKQTGADLQSEIADVKSDLSKVGLSDEAKEALLACFRNVAWANGQGNTFYGALEDALSSGGGKTLLSITAVFNQGTNIIYTDESLDTLKQYLTVTAHYDDNTDAEVTIYTLSGNLVEGTNTVTVSYGGKTTTFTVTAVDFYNIWEWGTEKSGVGKLFKDNSITDISKDGVRVGFATYVTSNNARFGVHVERGKHQAVDYDTGLLSDYYPIPIPKTATKVTISVTPSTDKLFGYVGKYQAGARSDGYDYTMMNESASWTHAGTYTCTFSADENLFLGYNGRKSDNTAYTDTEREDRVVTVVFE